MNITEIESLTISQCIEELKKLQEKYGDLPLFMEGDSDDYPFEVEDFQRFAKMKEAEDFQRFAKMKEAEDREDFGSWDLVIDRYPKRVVL